MGQDKPMTNERTLERHKSALLIVDMQEAFRTAISDFAEKANRIAVMARGAQLLQIPILLTEQYPKGLGRTAPEITEVIPRVAPVEKSAFSSCGARAFND